MKDFLLDSLTFIEEQVRSAKTSPGDQAAAIDAASGAVPFIRLRLEEDENLQARFMLLFAEQAYSGHWQEWWTELAIAKAPDFEDKANDLMARIETAKLFLAP